MGEGLGEGDLNASFVRWRSNGTKNTRRMRNMRRLVSGMMVAVAVLWAGGAAWALECPERIGDAQAAVQKAEAALDKAKAAAKAAARGPLNKAKEMLSHAEAEHKGAGQNVKKHAEAVREARTAQGYAEEARLIAEKL